MHRGRNLSSSESRQFRICRGGRSPRSSWPDWSSVRDVSSLGDWFPDEFGNVDHKVGAVLVRIVRRADLAYTYAHDVVEAAVAFAIAEVKDAANDLPSARWVGAAVSVPLDQDIVAPSSVSIAARKSGRNGPAAVRRCGKFAPRKRPLMEPSQRPSARNRCCSHPPSSSTIQLSGYVKRIRYSGSSRKAVLPLLAGQTSLGSITDQISQHHRVGVRCADASRAVFSRRCATIVQGYEVHTATVRTACRVPGGHCQYRPVIRRTKTINAPLLAARWDQPTK